MTQNPEHREPREGREHDGERHGRHEQAEHHEHEHHGVTEALRERPALSAILFDLRSVIGLLFVVYGLVLTILGIIGETPEELAKAGGIALNLWTGLAMLVIGIVFYVWAFTKPPLPPELDRSDHYEEGGPMHMGH
jgi:hypothetical protein